MIKESEFIKSVFQFYKLMKLNEVSLVYEGEITHDITKAFTSLTESAMDKADESSSTQRKVFHVMVECLQNISKHAEEVDLGEVHKEKRGVFLIHKDENQYGVTTGNVVSNDNISELTDQLNLINSLDKDGLKKLHKEQIKGGTLSEKQGAGLGFIDIAKKTGNPLEYHFLDIDDQVSFFILTSRIERKK